LYFFFWPLCCLFFFDIRILIAPLVSFVHCVVCSSSIYGFWLPLWYLLSIVLSVLLRYTDSDYFFFGIFKLLFYYRRYNCLLRLFAEVVLLVFNVYFSLWYFLCLSSFCVVLLVFNVYFSVSSYFLCLSSFCIVLLVFNVYFSVSSYFLCLSSFCIVLLVFNVYFSLWYFLCLSSFCIVLLVFKVYFSLSWYFLCFSSFCVVLLVFNVYFSLSWYFLCFSSFCVVLLVFNVYFSLSWYFLCFSSFCAVCQIVYMSLWFTCFQRPWRFLAFQSVNWVVDRDRMIVGFTTTYVIGAYHHFSCEFEYRSGEV
jgi:hypothetical protein